MNDVKVKLAQWKQSVSEFRKPSTGRAMWQLVSTIGAYVLTWVLIYFAVQISWWLTLPLIVVAGGLLIRIFIFFHDCGHGSFFRSKRANNYCGFICGVLTFTPYFRWRWQHARHHSTSGNLDRRGIGDIWTMTVQEYLDSPRWRRVAYRIIRNPFALFVIGPLVQMLIIERIPSKGMGARERNSVWWVNLAVLLMLIGLGPLFGMMNYIIIQVAITLVAGSVGIWLFYVQHQFEDVYWARNGEWDYVAAAVDGSSYYKLPRVLQWFSGNIGFHHIHHLNPSIPNYHLEKCHISCQLFSEITPLTLRSSLKSLSYRLWDESAQRLIRFDELSDIRAANAA